MKRPFSISPAFKAVRRSVIFDAANISSFHWVDRPTSLLTRNFLRTFAENQKWIYNHVFSPEHCRELAFKGVVRDKALNKNIVRNVTVQNEELCQWKCFLDDTCKSYNLGPPQAGGEGKRVCELSSSHHILHPQHLVSRPGFIYRSSVVSRKHRSSRLCSSLHC